MAVALIARLTGGMESIQAHVELSSSPVRQPPQWPMSTHDMGGADVVMTLRFTSDSSVRGRGFNLALSCDSGGTGTEGGH